MGVRGSEGCGNGGEAADKGRGLWEGGKSRVSEVWDCGVICDAERTAGSSYVAYSFSL